jgi:hypothetical protein
MAKSLGELFISPLYDKNSSIKNRSYNSSKYSQGPSMSNKLRFEKKSNIRATESNTFKTTTLSNYNEDDDNNSEIYKQNFNKKRTTLKEEIDIKQNYEQNIPNYHTRKNYDLLRIVEDQVIYFS